MKNKPIHLCSIFLCTFFLFGCAPIKKETRVQETAWKNKGLSAFNSVKNEKKRDYDSVFFKFVQADALTGSNKAQYRLGMLYKTPGSVNYSQETSTGWFLKAAAQGNTNALNELRKLNDKGSLGKEKWLKINKRYQENHSELNAVDMTVLDERTFEKAKKLLDDDCYKEALPLIKPLADKYSGHADLAWTASIVAKKSGDFPAALKYFKAYKDFVIYDIFVRANLIIVYHALGDREKRDLERKALYAYKALSSYLPPKKAIQSKAFVRGEFSIGSNHVSALEYFELLGNMGIKYAFRIVDTKTNKSWRISLGSYERINEFMKAERGLGPAASRFYHLDAYNHIDEHDSTYHWTLGFFHGEPEYDKIRAFVGKVVSQGPGKFAVSSSGLVSPEKKNSASKDLNAPLSKQEQ